MISPTTTRYTRCYIFVHHSNLWKTGRKVHAKKLEDTDIDKSYRIDFGKFLTMVVKDRNFAKPSLYGSVPPPNDSVWRAIREKNFNVKTFRSKGGREKELNSSMAFEIANTMRDLDRRHAVFIIVTGDRDLKTSIEGVLENEIPVELWSWKEHTARELKKLANKDLFTINYLDDKQATFSYTSVMSSNKRNINPAHAIVYTNIPKAGLYELADYFNRLEHQFYITALPLRERGKHDLVVEFPHTNPEVILTKIDRRKDCPYQPCSYPQYSAKPEDLPKLPLSNRFQALCIDDDDVLVDAADSQDLQDRTLSLIHGEHDGDEAEDYSKWESVLYKNPAVMERVRKRRETECQWKDHCVRASLCPYKHTEAEKKLFANHPNLDFGILKTRECPKKAQHITDEQKKLCTFAHTDEDSWCLICKIYGHLTDKCKAN